MQINSSSPSIINKSGEDVEVKHELFLTMIDVKIILVPANTPSASICTVYGTTPCQMNDLDQTRK